ncbi:MAG: TIGR04086 family membrane protein [Ruminococcus sp.]|nr:TIGR04086 family membrane protein [Ruminococcus sp.]
MKIKCRRLRSSFWESRCCCTLIAIAAGLLVTLICLSGFSVLMTSLDAPDSLVSCMAAIALCAGSFTAGFISAKHRRRHGLLAGLGCGIIIYFIVFFFGLLLLQSLSGAGTIMKLILIILCSCMGGVCGVNTRIRKPPR